MLITAEDKVNRFGTRYVYYHCTKRRLQKYHRCGLVTPVDVEHMYDAAIQSKLCILTGRGRYYWLVVSSNRI